MENSSKEIQQKKDKFVLNQSNTVSKTIIKISSATAYKIIKYGTHIIDLKFRFNKSKLPLEEYKKMDLLDSTNWGSVEWSDFCCDFSMTEFSKEMGITDGGKRRDLIRKMLDNATSEKIILEYQNKEKQFPWFVETDYTFDENNEVKTISLRFNPGIIGAALVNTGEHYSHLELLVVGKMKSFYGLRIYELIKAFYNKCGKYDNPPGIWKTDWYSVEQMKKFLQCEMAYVGRLNNFITKAIKNPVEEINQVCKELGINLHVEVEFERGGKGGKQIKALRFICNEKYQQLKISKADSEKAREEKRLLNEDLMESAMLKDKYKERWAEIENVVFEMNKDNPLFRNPEIRKGPFFEATCINYIKDNLENNFNDYQSTRVVKR